MLSIAPVLLHAVPLDIANVVPGETVRYPLLLLRGTAPGTAMIAGTSWKAMVRFPVANDRYAAAVELKPGPNFVLVQSARDLVKVQVNYRPMTTSYRVRAALVVAANEEPSDPKYRERIDLALKMLQSTCAESMREAGYGRLTFALDLGPDGRVPVRIVRMDAPGDALRSRTPERLWDTVGPEILKDVNPETNKVAGVLDFVRVDPRTKSGLGEADLGGGGLALVGGASLPRWPTSVADIPRLFADETPVEEGETGGRAVAWAATSTGVGALLHELGHTFGLPHSADVRSAMLRGFDSLNRRFVAVEPPRVGDASAHPVTPDDATHWDAFEAARLRLCPWFRPDGPRVPAALPPRVVFEGEDVAVSAPYGLGLVAALRDGKPTIFREFKGAKTARLKRSELGEGEATLVAVDVDGNETQAKLP